MNQLLSCRKLATLAGVSVRTLRYYDRIGLLRPSGRSEARYRHYGPNEQLRLQQILFYKELGFSLEAIRTLLDAPGFDLRQALHDQRAALQARRVRLDTLLITLDHTLAHLSNPSLMLTPEQLYAGFSREEVENYRRQARARHGAPTVEAAEQHLRQMGQPGLDQLKAEQAELRETLGRLRHLNPASTTVQQEVARHYANIVAFWGPAVPAPERLAAYRSLAQLYLDDPRFTRDAAGTDSPAYAAFLTQAMRHFVDVQA